jgi:hypothetical protein
MTIASTTQAPPASAAASRNAGPSAEEIALGRQRFAALLGIELPAVETPVATPAADTSGNAGAYEVTTDGSSLQISKKGAPAAQAATTGPLPVRVLPIAADAAKFAFDPIAMLQDRLRSRGIDTSGIKFDRVEQTNLSPGSAPLTFHYVRAQFPNGQIESYATEWILYNPDVTATEIGRLLGSPEFA